MDVIPLALLYVYVRLYGPECIDVGTCAMLWSHVHLVHCTWGNIHALGATSMHPEPHLCAKKHVDAQGSTSMKSGRIQCHINTPRHPSKIPCSRLCGLCHSSSSTFLSADLQVLSFPFLSAELLPLFLSLLKDEHYHEVGVSWSLSMKSLDCCQLG